MDTHWFMVGAIGSATPSGPEGQGDHLYPQSRLWRGGTCWGGAPAPCRLPGFRRGCARLQGVSGDRDEDAGKMQGLASVLTKASAFPDESRLCCPHRQPDGMVI